MSERVLILSVDKWEMPDEKTGELRRGLSVWYVNEYREDTPDAFGFKPTKIGAVPELFDTFKKAKLPSLCEVDFGSRPGAQNKATLTLVDFRLIGNLNLFAPIAAKGSVQAVLIADRVVCDFCYCLLGQLFNSSAQSSELIHDLAISPHFCVCPDCFDDSVIRSDYVHLAEPQVSVQKCIEV